MGEIGEEGGDLGSARESQKQLIILHPTVPFPGDHQRLFRSLNLHDFVHLNLTAEPLRPDLLTQLINNYCPRLRCSYVNAALISVHSDILARAVSLPLCQPLLDDDDDDDHLTLFTRVETATVLTRFITNWLVGAGERCVPPPEVVAAAVKLVQEGRPHEVDWRELVWAIVEKDLRDVSWSGVCYSASHLQRLIKYQLPELFKEEGDGACSSLKDSSFTLYCRSNDEENMEEGSGWRTEANAAEFTQMAESIFSSPRRYGDDLASEAQLSAPESSTPSVEGGNVSYDLPEHQLAITFTPGRNSKRHIDDAEKEEEEEEGNGSNVRLFTRRSMQKRTCSDGKQASFTKMEKLLKVVPAKNKKARLAVRKDSESMNKMLRQKYKIIRLLKKARVEYTKKAKMVLADKKRVCAKSKMELQQKDEIIRSLEKAKLEDAKKAKMVLAEKEQVCAKYKVELQQKDEIVRSLEKAKVEDTKKAKMVLAEKERVCAKSKMVLRQKDEIIRSLEKARLEDAKKTKMVLAEKEQVRAKSKMELQQKDEIIRSLEKARSEEAQKANMVLEEKEQACVSAQMELRKKDEIIRSVEKARTDEVQKRESEVSRFSHELSVMTGTIEGYKKDLKEKDELHRTAEVIDSLNGKFTECADLIPKLAVTFMEINEHFEFLKETHAKPRVSETKFL